MWPLRKYSLDYYKRSHLLLDSAAPALKIDWLCIANGGGNDGKEEQISPAGAGLGRPCCLTRPADTSHFLTPDLFFEALSNLLLSVDPLTQKSVRSRGRQPDQLHR